MSDLFSICSFALFSILYMGSFMVSFSWFVCRHGNLDFSRCVCVIAKQFSWDPANGDVEINGTVLKLHESCVVTKVLAFHIVRHYYDAHL